ncbi:MAG: hypothetical protein IJU20_00725 [Clostridia bacterium]|nr:hypothetical protein [Clostridia bacterium]
MPKVKDRVDLSPWAYVWRRDAEVQEKPEAYFIIRRLNRQEKIYRTLLPQLGYEQAKAICYRQDDIVTEQIPSPSQPLLTGILWEGGLTDYRVQLTFPAECPAPDPAQMEVRTYPTAWGWFGWSNDRMMELTSVSKDGRTLTYTPPEGTMDYAYNARRKAQSECICVFAPEGVCVPSLHVIGDSLGCWEEVRVRAFWGLDGKYENLAPTALTHVAWVEKEEQTGERERVYTCLYSPVSRYGNDSRLTLVLDRSEGLGATVLLRDLKNGPVYVPEVGMFFATEESGMTPDAYRKKCEKEQLKTMRERVREHEEAKSWEELMRHVRLWRCPPDVDLGEFPDAPAPNVPFSVPDRHLQIMYELAVEQLRGPNMWGMLAAEVARPALAMEMAGLKPEADRIYQYFLDSPGVRADGDYTDPAGSFEWAKSMRHDMGYAHEGTHCSTGRMLFSMMQRYLFYRDREWLDARMDRFKKAADFIIKEIRSYGSEIPNREKLRCYGLMPPVMFGDYALPASDWRWYMCDNAYAQVGLSAFADVLKKIGDPQADYYLSEADRYRRDLMRAIREEGLFAPVRRSGDGASYSFLPRMLYAGGLLHYREETNIPQFALGINDLFQGALPLSDQYGVLDPNDRRMVGTLNAMEDAGLRESVLAQEKLAHPTANAAIREEEERLLKEREQKGQSDRFTEELRSPDHWFWNYFSNLPKISHNSNVYLRQDDIPNFLHYFFNHAIVMVGTNGKMWEHAHPDIYAECRDPDNGTAAWFVENFRNMLLTEESGVLWIAKGTPRAWLEDGKSVGVEKAPSYFGNVTYTITSFAAQNYMDVNISVPDLREDPTVRVRLRHPEGKKILDVSFGHVLPDGETIEILHPVRQMQIRAHYRA